MRNATQGVTCRHTASAHFGALAYDGSYAFEQKRGGCAVSTAVERGTFVQALTLDRPIFTQNSCSGWFSVYITAVNGASLVKSIAHSTQVLGSAILQ